MRGVCGWFLPGWKGVQVGSVSTQFDEKPRYSICLTYISNILTHSPSPDRPSPESYLNPPMPDPSTAGPPPQLPAGYGRWREYKYDPAAVVIPAPAWLEGGSLSGWRSGGITSQLGMGQGGGGGFGRGGQEQGSVGAFGPAGGGGHDRFNSGNSGGSGSGYGGGGGGGDGGERKRGFVKDLSTVLCFVSLSPAFFPRRGLMPAVTWFYSVLLVDIAILINRNATSTDTLRMPVRTRQYPAIEAVSSGEIDSVR